jgi:iron complex transport system substrate-binding protein
MRIVSLLPSATEICYALGLQDSLVGVTHECDYPPDAATKPVVVESVFPNNCKDMAPVEVDSKIAESIRTGAQIYRFKPGALEAAKPDVILAQGLCDVCAVPYRFVVEEIRKVRGNPQVMSLDPVDLTGILTDIRRVGELCGRVDEAGAVVDALEERVGEVAGPTRELPANQRPRVAVIEWTDPIYVGGHWVPELVELAGGIDVLGVVGEPSKAVEWSTVVASKPDVVIVAPCGYDISRAKAELPRLQALPGWSDLPAVKDGKVYFMDANATLSRPGPRMVDAVEDIAQMIHPEIFGCLVEARRWSE